MIELTGDYIKILDPKPLTASRGRSGSHSL